MSVKLEIISSLFVMLFNLCIQQGQKEGWVSKDVL